MTSRLTAALAALTLVLIPGLAPGLARAQQRAAITHGGVDVDALTPRGLVRTDATVPLAAEVPVRLTFAGQPGAPNELVIGVLVGSDAAAARAALDRFTAGVQRDVPRDATIGDVTVHVSGDLLAFARDNVFVFVRHLAGSHDAATVARAIDALIVAAPTGATHAAAPTLQVGARIATSDPRLAIYSLLPAAGSLALEVSAHRTGISAYHTSRGWFARVRTSGVVPTSADFTVRAVDAHLRVTD